MNLPMKMSELSCSLVIVMLLNVTRKNCDLKLVVQRLKVNIMLIQTKLCFLEVFLESD